MKSVFICGTGRCGTTITKYVLARHSEVFSFIYETRFMDDPYGIIDLYQTLAERWSVWNAEVVWREFKRLIHKKKSILWTPLYKYFRNFQSNRKTFTVFSPPRYAYLDIHDFEDIVSECLPQLARDLEVIEYKGAWPGLPSFTFNPEICIPMCHDLTAVTQALKHFLENLIGKIMQRQGGRIWIDDSIYNHLNADILLNIIPEAKFIHIQRDPRDVIASYKTKLWSPPDAIQSAKLYRSIIERWNKVKQQLPDSCYLEVTFEDLYSDPKKEFQKMCQFIDLPWMENILDIDLSQSHIGRWEKDLSPEELESIAPIIQPFIKRKDTAVL